MRFEVQTAHVTTSRTEVLLQVAATIALLGAVVQALEVVAPEVLEVVQEVQGALEVPVVHRVHQVPGHLEEEVAEIISKPKLKISKDFI